MPWTNGDQNWEFRSGQSDFTGHVTLHVPTGSFCLYSCGLRVGPGS